MNKNFKLKLGDKVFCTSRIDGEKHIFTISVKTTISEIESDWGFVTKVLRPSNYKVIYEAEKEILDEKEKEYLNAVIKPFKNKVKYIIKYSSFVSKDLSFIKIKLENCFIGKNQLGNDDIDLPYFETGTMYQGMENERKYTLEELGLE